MIGYGWVGFDAYLYFLTVIEWVGYVVLGLIGILVLIDLAYDHFVGDVENKKHGNR